MSLQRLCGRLPENAREIVWTAWAPPRACVLPGQASCLVVAIQWLMGLFRPAARRVPVPAMLGHARGPRGPPPSPLPALPSPRSQGGPRLPWALGCPLTSWTAACFASSGLESPTPPRHRHRHPPRVGQNLVLGVRADGAGRGPGRGLEARWREIQGQARRGEAVLINLISASPSEPRRADRATQCGR